MPQNFNNRRHSSGRPGGFNRSGGYRGGSRSGSAKRGPKKDYIHPSKFIKAAKPVHVEPYIAANSFSDFEIAEVLKKNIEAKGFVTPSPIQDQAIPVGLTGCDVIGIANTGTGKTVAFAIPVLNKLLEYPNSKAVIMAPTRELAQQILDECKSIGKNTGLFGALLIGGAPMGPQLRDLRSKPRVIIGTPGRIKDHIERGSLDISDVDTVVLDEVDRMLDMGFIHDMREILGYIDGDKQSFFFSATLDQRVKQLIGSFMYEPVTISVKTGETSDNVEQDVIRYTSEGIKIEHLHDVLVKQGDIKALVFDDTQRSVERLSNELVERGFKADAIHGGKTQGQRQRALDKFKKNHVNILVATDVAARGIDVADVTHVINYSTPQTYDDYVHRVGRAGRAGRSGFALTFVEDRSF